MSEHVDSELPPCPECDSAYTYESGPLLVCPMCGHEWSAGDQDDHRDSDGDGSEDRVVRDANGNVLEDGDDVTLVKSVKVSGGGGATLKVGTKIRGIKLVEDRGDGHDIDARIPGMGRLRLKSSIVKKS